MKVAKDHTGYNFAVSNKDDFQHELSEFGLDFVAGDKPAVTARAGGLKYKMASEFSVDNLIEFVEGVQSGDLEAYIKSEPVPDNSANAVKVAVAKNFEELVTKSEKDVLVEFYAPWCGHCKKLTPIYDELGEKMTDEEVEIVKMDATANDVPPAFDVKVSRSEVFLILNHWKLIILYSDLFPGIPHSVLASQGHKEAGLLQWRARAG